MLAGPVDLPPMNTEHKDAGKQASHTGPVDLPSMNNEPKDAGKQASLMMGPVDLPPINHEPMNHMNCTDEHMDNSTTDNKIVVRHARQIFDPMDTPSTEHNNHEHNDQQMMNHVDLDEPTHDTNENTYELNTMNPPLTMN